jgi:hypothetical protein
MENNMAEIQLDLFGSNEEMLKGAYIDPTGNYRYRLWRDWDNRELHSLCSILAQQIEKKMIAQ